MGSEKNVKSKKINISFLDKIEIEEYLGGYE
jgi:hypothetical protein